MSDLTPGSPLRNTATVFANGRVLLLVILVCALVDITALAILHDIDSQSVVAIFSAVIGGAVGHANGNLQGQLAAQLRQEKQNGN